MAILWVGEGNKKSNAPNGKGKLWVSLRRCQTGVKSTVGHTFSQPDLIIAATALQHGLTVVTRDVADFERERLSLLNPWAEAASS